MFTGIIEAKGQVVEIEAIGGDVRIGIQTEELDLKDVQLGDSIATNGVCLTVIKLMTSNGESEGENNLENNAVTHGYYADVSVETLDLTTIKHWSEGSVVNLEKALTPQTRLGGHLVSGHVDGIGEVVGRYSDARAERFTIKAPDSLAKYIAHKGSITVDGTSLTINAVNGNEFELAIVPHTLHKTVIGDYQQGSKVNLEVDLIARYLERLLLGDKAAEKIN